ncbi:acyltransferase [Streptococcus uberis]|uniref:acyltransferase n=1 Tax=Streptococcus uberis TaxID=1349 RepID=UPI002EA2F68B|nr:acyltransferase [Streptococcus uberis]
MNKYLRVLTQFPFAMIKFTIKKILHVRKFSFHLLSFISILSEFTIDRGANVKLGKMFKQNRNSVIRVRKKAIFETGVNFAMNNGCMIVAHEKIIIGDTVQLGPNVLIYDHDHDYKAEGGIKANLYKTSPIVIGNNVWIGAGSVVLRGTQIGDNSVIAAGSIVRGTIEPNSLFYQKKENMIKKIL